MPVCFLPAGLPPPPSPDQFESQRWSRQGRGLPGVTAGSDGAQKRLFLRGSPALPARCTVATTVTLRGA